MGLFYEHEMPSFAAKQPDTSIAKYCSMLGYKLLHVTIGEI